MPPPVSLLFSPSHKDMIYLIEIIVTTPYGIVIFFVNGVIVAVANVQYIWCNSLNGNITVWIWYGNSTRSIQSQTSLNGVDHVKWLLIKLALLEIKNVHQEISTGGYLVGVGLNRPNGIEGLVTEKAWGMGLRPTPHPPHQERVEPPKSAKDTW